MLPFGARAGVFWDTLVGVFGGLESFERSSSHWLLFGACFLVSLFACHDLLPLGNSKVWQNEKEKVLWHV